MAGEGREPQQTLPATRLGDFAAPCSGEVNTYAVVYRSAGAQKRSQDLSGDCAGPGPEIDTELPS